MLQCSVGVVQVRDLELLLASRWKCRRFSCRPCGTGLRATALCGSRAQGCNFAFGVLASGFRKARDSIEQETDPSIGCSKHSKEKGMQERTALDNSAATRTARNQVHHLKARKILVTSVYGFATAVCRSCRTSYVGWQKWLKLLRRGTIPTSHVHVGYMKDPCSRLCSGVQVSTRRARHFISTLKTPRSQKTKP